MKKDILQNAIGGLDDALIDAADREITPKKKGKLLTVGLIAAAAALLTVLAVLGVSAMQKEQPAPPAASSEAPVSQAAVPSGTPSKDTTGQPDESSETAQIPHWEDMIDCQRYASFIRGGIEYSTQLIYIHPENVGEKLGEVTARGYDAYSDTVKTIPAELFAISGISEDAALCIRFKGGDSKAYGYTNTLYRAATLGDLVSDLNLTETLTANGVYDMRDRSGKITQYENVPVSLLLAILTANTDAKNVADEVEPDRDFEVSASVDLVGCHYHAIAFSEDGYLWTNLLGSAQVFYVGTDTVRDFIETVTEHYEGSPYVPTPLDGLTDEIEE